MYNAASGWLMTSLNPDPLIVALVQAANTLPIFLLALPAGAFADIFDKRKYLIVVETLYTAISAIGWRGHACQFIVVHLADRRGRCLNGPSMAGSNAAPCHQRQSIRGHRGQ